MKAASTKTHGQITPLQPKQDPLRLAVLGKLSEDGFRHWHALIEQGQRNG